jgi:hypothetical protein
MVVGFWRKKSGRFIADQVNFEKGGGIAPFSMGPAPGGINGRGRKIHALAIEEIASGILE